MEHAEELAKDMKEYVNEHKKLQFNIKEERPKLLFFTHSLGGVILRAALNHREFPEEAKIGKSVLVAPPMRGSAWARFLSNYTIARTFMGNKMGRELCQTCDGGFEYIGDIPNTMDVLIILGHGHNPILKDGPNDGIVYHSESRINTPHKIIKISNATHFGLQFHSSTIRTTINFFNGKEAESVKKSGNDYDPAI